jgi:replicative DNA helicase
MADTRASYTRAADLLAQWRDDVLTGKPPVLYPVGSGELTRIQIGPGLVTLFGGAPGAGKTAFTMQCIIDALRLTPALRVCVCNVEMSPAALLDRQLARISGIDLTAIRHRKLIAAHAERIELAMNVLELVAERLCFVRPPFDLANVAATADAFHADLLLLDYIQRIPPPGDHGDKRSAVDATMNYLRQFADAKIAVIVVAAVSRTKDSRGRSSYAGEGLNLASFRESSELEFGADDAFMLVGDAKGADLITLKHLKSRHGEAQDITLRFDRPRQHFAVADDVGEKRLRTPPPNVKPEQLAALWNRTPAAADSKGDGE